VVLTLALGAFSMLVKFNQNLGIQDANAIKTKYGVEVVVKDCVIGATVDIPAKAYEFLAKKYKAVVEPVSVKGEAKKTEITAPSK
jgi:hypothetical protein